MVRLAGGLHIVAVVAAFFDRKGGVAVVASPTGFAVSHLLHADSAAAIGVGNKQVGVAVTAIVDVGVDLMAEKGITLFELEADVVSWVATGTVAGDRKGFGAVMTGATGFPLFHISHVDWQIFAGIDMKNPIMAKNAVVADGFQVLIMAESDSTHGSVFQVNNILNPACRGKRRKN